jgi:hypothetical protein
MFFHDCFCPEALSIALGKKHHLKNATIINVNYDDVDISEADVVTLYQSAKKTRG